MARNTVLRIARAVGLERQLRHLWAVLQGGKELRNWRDDEQLRRLIASMPADSGCVDIGANLGVILSAMVSAAPHGRHVAFEPVPELAAELSARFPGVEVRAVALAAATQPERPFVHVTDRESRSGFHTGGYADPHFASSTILVPTETLDDALPADYTPALIKIDVEGSELEVLQGAHRVIERHSPIIAFEHSGGDTTAELHCLLCDRHGFELFDMDFLGPLSSEQFTATLQLGKRWNFVAVPPGRDRLGPRP